MKVSELGEFGLIKLLAKMISRSQNKKWSSYQQLILGIGDDAAAFHSEDSIQLLTTDALFEGVHFTLKTTPWYELGWKALAVNLSDIAAMGGVPRYAVVALTLPEHTEVADVEALYQGMLALAEPFEVAIIGGDTDKAPRVSITVTVLGKTKDRQGQMLTRSAAKPGDKIAVTGYLGGAAAGLEMLTKPLQFDEEATAELKKAFLHPCPRVAEGQLLVAKGVKAAIDISDGLVSDLNHICQSSRVGARVEVDRVPVSPAVKASFGKRALELALSGGEDYELLFTAGTEVMAEVKKALSCPVSVIGDIVAEKAGKVTLVGSDGKSFQLRQAGWEHFKT